MANVNIDVGEGSLLVYKGIDFDFTFNISVPIETEEDLTTKEYLFNHVRDMETKSEFLVRHLKKDWIRVDSFEIGENETSKILNITGIPKAKFKYKVEFLNTNGEVIQVLKDYSTDYISLEEPLTDTIKVPISLITTSVNTYNISVTVLFENKQTVSQNKEVVLYNKKPTIIGTVENNTLFIQIGDEENDLVKYNVYMNGEKIYPQDADFTGFEPPSSNTIKLKSTDIKINQLNTITINVEDNWGETNSFTYEFIGEYIGLLFMDEKGEYYSTDIGDILKRLNFGQIFAGSMSDIKKVIVVNNMGVDIKDLEIVITPESKPNKLTVFYGFDAYSLVEDTQQLIKNEVVKNKGTVDLYLRIYPDIEFEYRNAKFEIKAQAQPVL